MTADTRTRERVYLKRMLSYDPYNRHARSNGTCSVWKAYRDGGELITYGYTRRECEQEARRLGYVPVVES